MIFGLTFQCGGETAQIRITPESQLHFRITDNGEWLPWKRADVERAADGSLNEAVMECVLARQAQKLQLPMKLVFSGDAAGSVAFDGSEDVSCSLSLQSSVTELIASSITAAIAEHIQRYHRSTSE